MLKRGVTMSMLVAIIAVIAIITVTITISASNTMNNSKLRTFATEIAYIQSTYRTYIKNSNANDISLRDIVINVGGLTAEQLEQLDGENITSNTLLLHVINLDKLGISSTAYGQGETETDYYVFSEDTNNVYYLAGYTIGEKVYYSYTSELKTLVDGVDNSSGTSYVLYNPNTTHYTKEAVTVVVKIPQSFSSYSVVTTNPSINVTEDIVKDGYKHINVNNTSAIKGNYIITVAINGTKIETYNVDNYDDTSPTITVGSKQVVTSAGGASSTVLSDIVASDNSGKIKFVKYEKTKINSDIANKYFSEYGTQIIQDKILLDDSKDYYTIYAEDYAGNYAVKIISVD